MDWIALTNTPVPVMFGQCRHQRIPSLRFPRALPSTIAPGCQRVNRGSGRTNTLLKAAEEVRGIDGH